MSACAFNKRRVPSVLDLGSATLTTGTVPVWQAEELGALGEKALTVEESPMKGPLSLVVVTDSPVSAKNRD